MIRPEIWQSEQVSKLTGEEFKIYIGLISLADDEGRLRGSPVLLAAQIYPLTVGNETPKQVRKAIEKMESLNDPSNGIALIGVYQEGDEVYIFHPHWERHQTINRAAKSKLPTPPGREKYQKTRKSVKAHGYSLK